MKLFASLFVALVTLREAATYVISPRDLCIARRILEFDPVIDPGYGVEPLPDRYGWSIFQFGVDQCNATDFTLDALHDGTLSNIPVSFSTGISYCNATFTSLSVSTVEKASISCLHGSEVRTWVLTPKPKARLIYPVYCAQKHVHIFLPTILLSNTVQLAKSGFHGLFCVILKSTSVFTRRIEASRMENATRDTLNRWFDAVQDAINEFKIDPSDIYNMDETGFAIGSMESTRAIVDTSVRTQWQAIPGRQEWISIVECICADGMVLDPFVIFKGKTVLNKWIPRSLESNWSFSANSNGWTSNIHGLEWLTEIFEPLTREKAGGQTRLLICDGHDSHISGNFISHCMNHNIQLLVLPPHTSHMLQPLDIGIFGPLKKALTAALSPLQEAQITRIQKAEWLEAYMEARRRTFNAQNIASAWRGAGLVPLDRKKALRYLPEVEQVPVEAPPQTPTKQTFGNVYITSSSPDYAALHMANEALSEHIQVLKTPVRSFLREQAVRTEQHSARSRILEHENRTLRNLLNKRREAKKGKRAVLKGRYRITIEELRDGVKAAEKQTSERATKKSKQANNENVNTPEISPERVDVSDEDDESDMNDCIVVCCE